MKYDLSVYDKHLSSHKLVREHEIPYMNGWVRHYLLLGNRAVQNSVDSHMPFLQPNNLATKS